MKKKKGDWKKLTTYLQNLNLKKGKSITLTDKQMGHITGSTDRRINDGKPLPIKDHPTCNINRRAKDASFSVLANGKEKVFTKL